MSVSSFPNKELARRALAIAETLTLRGVGQGTALGVLVPRSVELVASLLGVMMSGAAYVPLTEAIPPNVCER